MSNRVKHLLTGAPKRMSNVFLAQNFQGALTALDHGHSLDEFERGAHVLQE